MKLRTTILLAAIVLVHSPARAQTLPPGMNEPIVHAGLFITDVNGDPGGGSATQTGEKPGADMAGTVYLAPCSTLGGANPGHAVSSSATEVWRLSGTVLELTAEQASVHVGWQRLRRDGQEEVAAPQSVTLTLKRGEKSTLETIVVPASGACAARYASLEVAFATRTELFARGRASTSRTAPTGGGGGRVFTDSRGGVSSMSIARPGQSAPRILSGDLWLVRTVPGRPDETLHLTSPIVQTPRPFAFAPVRVQTPAGTLTVTVKGTVEVGLTPDGERRFYFAANRTVTFASSERPAQDGPPIVEGSTKTTVTVPGPEEVLAFEMPPLRVPGGATLPDRLSIRVRVTSVAMQEITRPQ